MRAVKLAFATLVATATFATVSPVASAETAVGYIEGQRTALQLTQVDGAKVEIRTAKAFRVMAHAAMRVGLDLRIRSGFRSFEKQSRLYKDYRRGHANLAAPPGYSNHERGTALDLYITDHRVFDWLQEHGSAFGFHRTVPGEAWHWEYLGDEDKTALARTSHKTAKRSASKSR